MYSIHCIHIYIQVYIHSVYNIYIYIQCIHYTLLQDVQPNTIPHHIRACQWSMCHMIWERGGRWESACRRYIKGKKASKLEKQVIVGKCATLRRESGIKSPTCSMVADKFQFEWYDVSTSLRVGQSSTYICYVLSGMLIFALVLFLCHLKATHLQMNGAA